jgi:hypothetical protein
MVYFDKDQELFERTVQYWSDCARESKVEALQQRQDLSKIDPKISGLDNLQSRIIESYARTNEFEDAMESIQHMFRRLYINSPHNLDHQALYRACGSEGSADAGYNKDDSAQFENVEIDNGNNASPSNRAVRMIAADHRYAVQMAESRAHAEPRRLHG